MPTRWSQLAVVSAAVCLATTMTVVARSDRRSESHRLPSRLSATGLYADVGTLRVAEHNESFSPQYPLWTDGATKRRWVFLPPGSGVDATDVDDWEFPVGTRFWKEFAFAGRRVETRMLVKVSSTRWVFASYVWNAEQTDAVLAPEEGMRGVAEIGPGRFHDVPSVTDCRACHESPRSAPLGFTALQLSDDRDPLAPHAEAVAPHQLTLRRLMADGRVRVVTGALERAPRIPASSPTERATLGYLSANCGACHNATGELAPLGLNLRQPAYNGGLAVVQAGLARRTKWDRPGAPPETTHVFEPARVDSSALLVRMRSRRPVSQMPPLGTVMPDDEAIGLVAGWLRGLAVPR